jgi:hypothetical protein
MLCEELSGAVIGAAMEVHTLPGAGFLESVHAHAFGGGFYCCESAKFVESAAFLDCLFDNQIRPALQACHYRAA